MIWGRDPDKWHPWFAWRPVRCTDGRKAWLHLMARKSSGDIFIRFDKMPWEEFVRKYMERHRNRVTMEDPLGQHKKDLPPVLEAFRELIEKSVAEGRII